MAERKSGGMRATETRRAREQALQDQHAKWSKADLRAFRGLKKQEPTAAGAMLEGLAALRLAVRRAGMNPVLTPKERHEMVGRHAAALVKAADPAKLLQEQGAELRQALAVIESLEVKLRAARSAPAGSSGDPAPDLQ